MDTLAAQDPQLAPLIKEAQEFRVETDGTESPYEVLLESIAYQSLPAKPECHHFAANNVFRSRAKPMATAARKNAGARFLLTLRPKVGRVRTRTRTAARTESTAAFPLCW